MKLTAIPILMLVFIVTAISEEDLSPEIKIEQIQFSRILPHAYCDQRKASIKSMFPNSELITFQRFSYLAGKPYCLMAYRENKEADVIKVTGVFLIGMNSFWFESTTSRANFGIALLSVTELIAGYKIQE